MTYGPELLLVLKCHSQHRYQSHMLLLTFQWISKGHVNGCAHYHGSQCIFFFFFLVKGNAAFVDLSLRNGAEIYTP